MDDPQMIPKNIDLLREKVSAASEASGRKLSDITIVGVTKTIDVGRIKQAVESGITVLGENRVQELLEKHDEIKDCEWHMIGHLQKNKAKFLPGKVTMVQSLDSVELAVELDRRARYAGVVLRALVEVNVSGEESKFGIGPQETTGFLEKISGFPNLKIQGLMTVAPYSDNPTLISKIFERMYKIYIDMRSKKLDNVDMNYLSMGMSHDYELAIKEGSNMIRVGTAIFGARK